MTPAGQGKTGSGSPVAADSVCLMRKNYFDERIAESYEAKWPHLFEPAAVDPVVSFLAGLAGSGPALELGIGTGRIALPLSQRGIPVHGIDLSEAMIAQRLAPGETIRAFTVTPAHLGFDEYDTATQSLISHHYWVEDGKLDILSAPFRYVWPSELDLMARLAGMTLRERHSDWKREPFTRDSTTHVSVWQKNP